MRILVIGANGRTGHEVCQLIPENELVRFEGDVLDIKNVERQLIDVDVVVSVLGHVKGSDAYVQSEGMKNIVNAMHKHKVSRIISLTGTGVRIPGDKITLIDRILNLAISIIDPKRVADGKQHVGVLQASSLNWTVVRVLKLTNGKQKTNWQLLANGPTLPFVSRKTVAAAIVSILKTESFNQQAPILSPKQN